MWGRRGGAKFNRVIVVEEGMIMICMIKMCSSQRLASPEAGPKVSKPCCQEEQIYGDECTGPTELLGLVSRSS